MYMHMYNFNTYVYIYICVYIAFLCSMYGMFNFVVCLLVDLCI